MSSSSSSTSQQSQPSSAPSSQQTQPVQQAQQAPQATQALQPQQLQQGQTTSQASPAQQSNQPHRRGSSSGPNNYHRNSNGRRNNYNGHHHYSQHQQNQIYAAPPGNWQGYMAPLPQYYAAQGYYPAPAQGYYPAPTPGVGYSTGPIPGPGTSVPTGAQAGAVPHPIDLPARPVSRSPAFSPPRKSVGISIKTKDGQPVTFARGHGKTSSYSSANSSAASTPLQPTPVQLAAPVAVPIVPQPEASSPEPVDVERKKTNADFKAAFLAKLKEKEIRLGKKKVTNSETAEINSETQQEVKQESKTESTEVTKAADTTVEPKAPAEPKVESVQKGVETEIVTPAAEPEVDVIKPRTEPVTEAESKPEAPTVPKVVSHPSASAEPVPEKVVEPVEKTDEVAEAETEKPAGTTEPAKLTEEADLEEPTPSKELAEPVDLERPTEAVEKIEPKEPAESVEPIKPTEPTEPAEPAEPEEPKESAEATEPTQPKESEQPKEQEQPAEPEEPTKPKELAESTESEPQTEPKEPVPVTKGSLEESAEQEPVDATSVEPEEEKVEVPEVPQMTMTELFAKVTLAKPVEDVYTFKYPEGSVLPDKKFEKYHKRTYDPGFLYQFSSVCQFDVDDEWQAKYGSKVVIPEGRGGGRNFRNNSQYGRGMSRSAALRGDFNGSGNGSRGGSRRRMGREKSRQEGSRRRRDNRSNTEFSRRGTHRGDLREPVELTEAAMEAKDNAESAPPAIEVEPLKPTKNRWVPRSMKKKEKEIKYAPDGVTVLLDDEDVQAKIQSLLNKLTLEKFDEISEDMLKIANQSQWEDDAHTLKRVIELTFAKACDESHWSNMYAKWCLKLCKSVDAEVKDLKDEDIDDSRNSGSGLVHYLLVSRCQTEYEKGWEDKLPSNEDGSPLEPDMMSDEYYKMAGAKRRGLGLVRFIGELFSYQLLNRHVIMRCIVQILSNDEPSEEAMETLIQLLNTCGPGLDQVPETRHHLDMTFSKMNNIVEMSKMSSRIKFKILDLMDLRKKNWRDKAVDAGPKTISEIHAEADRKREREEMDKERRRHHGGSNGGRGGSDRRESHSSRSGSRWGSSDRLSSKDLSKVGVVRNSSEGSLGPFKKSKAFQTLASLRRNQRSTDNFTTVSGSMRSPSTRSTRSPSSPEPTAEPREASRNRFAALGLDEDEVGSDEEREE
ncbi:DEKNAAC104521 [Brettanomyces naardenensis]|uniref:DEKNAAC104521 n=1 Tax=Brettanomyces naardenensis TaxID=13370 RepID=A0A448YRM6_BRENA|nr:DEKNAAC104521 [Brettanomyces naardenensis]